MTNVVLNDLNFHYEVYGTKDPLVLIAGLSCDSNHWMMVKEELAQHYQVICLDNRSVGRTDTAKDLYYIDDMAHDVIALLDHLGINKATIIGHSMGGAIAQTIAYRYQSRVDKLVISNSLVKLTSKAKLWIDYLEKFQNEGLPLDVTVPFTAPWVYSDKFLSRSAVVQELINMYKNYPYPQTPVGFAQQAHAIRNFDSTNWVGQIKANTLIIAGEEDYLTPVTDACYMNQQIKNSKLLIQEGSHVPMIEIPNLYIEKVLEFLGS